MRAVRAMGVGVAAMLAIGCASVTAPADDGPYPRPVPPEIVKEIMTPAKVSTVGNTLHVNGTIIDEAVDEVLRQLRAGNGAIRSLVIKSAGGEGNAGIHFGEIVRDWKLAVTVDGRCMSACANYVALAAPELHVPDGALLGYHGGPSKTWGDDGDYLEEQKRIKRSMGTPDRFFPSLLATEKKIYARQQALFDSVGVSSAIIEDTGRGSGTTVRDLWMFTRDALERCYNVKNIKQYPTLTEDTIPNGKATMRVVRECPRKVQ